MICSTFVQLELTIPRPGLLGVQLKGDENREDPGGEVRLTRLQSTLFRFSQTNRFGYRLAPGLLRVKCSFPGLGAGTGLPSNRPPVFRCGNVDCCFGFP